MDRHTEPAREGAGSSQGSPGLGGGAALARLREQAGWTVEQLAASLKISPTKLRALEADRYEALGEPVFFRGYAATACRILGADPRPVLDKLPAAKAPALGTARSESLAFASAPSSAAPVANSGVGADAPDRAEPAGPAPTDPSYPTTLPGEACAAPDAAAENSDHIHAQRSWEPPFLHDGSKVSASPQATLPPAPRVEPAFEPAPRAPFSLDPSSPDPAVVDTALRVEDLRSRSAARASVATRRKRWIAAAAVAVMVVAVGVAGMAPSNPGTSGEVAPAGAAQTSSPAQIRSPQEATADAAIVQAGPPVLPSSQAPASPAPGMPAPSGDAPGKRPANRAGSIPPDPPSTQNARQPSSKPPADAQKQAGRFIVQLASYRTEGQAREVKRRVESLGLRGYYQVLQTPEGPRYRVRVGPFQARAEAQRAQERLNAVRLRGSVRAL